MTRTLTANMLTAVAATTGALCHLYEFQFSGGTERFTDAAMDLSWDSQTWSAAPMYFEAVQESPDLAAQSVEITLDGVDTTVITHVLGEHYIGRTAKIRLCHFDSDGTITTDPAVIFSGYMNDTFKVDERPNDTCRVRTRLVSQLAVLKQRRGIRADLHSHQAHYPGDTFFRHMTEVGWQPVYWGRESGDPRNAAPGTPDYPRGRDGLGERVW